MTTKACLEELINTLEIIDVISVKTKNRLISTLYLGEGQNGDSL